MGIPLLAAFLRKKSESIVTKAKPPVDNLAIDMNGMIHPICQKIFKYGKHKPLRSLKHPGNTGGLHSEKFDYLALQQKVFETIAAKVEELVTLLQPRKRLIMCIDGVAGLSKMFQQRQRRFRSAMENSGCKFDPNAISPGTLFMHYLTKYLDYFIRMKVSKEWKHLEVIFSSEKVASEGEHKLISYFRYCDKNESFIIHGLDADLVMLGLATHYPKFFIIREPEDDQYEYLSISEVRRLLTSSLTLFRSSAVASSSNVPDEDQKTAPTAEEKRERQIVDDFILICYLIGNDFLPHSPSLEIIHGGLDTILKVYDETALPLTASGRFISNHLKLFLLRLAELEPGLIIVKAAAKPRYPDLLLKKYTTLTEVSTASIAPVGPCNDPNYTKYAEIWKALEVPASKVLGKEVSSEAPSPVKQISVDFEGYLEEYYQLKFPTLRKEKTEQRERKSKPVEVFSQPLIDRKVIIPPAADFFSSPFEKPAGQGHSVTFEKPAGQGLEEETKASPERGSTLNLDQRKEIALRYLEGMAWVFTYYTKGIPSWNWQYPYQYAPFLCDLAAALDDYQHINYPVSQPLTPLQQLLFIMPPASMRLLPQPLQDICREPELLEYYPSKVAVDLNGKQFDWQGVILLPLVDVQKLSLQYFKRYHRLKPEDQRRNQPGKSYSYVYTEKTLPFQSQFGNLLEGHCETFALSYL